jgi:TetR/AcrR family transcriptional regulator, transcriptional repressor for nem operon
MKATPKGERTQARVLKTVRQLVRERGFCNTSIDDIIRATGVKKGNLYFHFASKEDLGLAVLEDARKDFVRFLSDNLQGNGPLEKLSAFFDAVLDRHRQRRFVGGCLFGNTALEMSDSNQRFADVIKEVFGTWVGTLAPILRQAQEAGDLQDNLPPELLAKQIVATIEGGIMMARLSKDGNDLRDCLNSLRLLLGVPVSPSDDGLRTAEYVEDRIGYKNLETADRSTMVG